MGGSVSRASIRDVAAAAQVGVGTVSHYLNHPEKVSQEKGRRIREAIEQLGYIPNSAARQLRLGRTSAIAYISPDVSNPFFAEIAESVERRAAQRGAAIFIANSGRNRSREDAYLEFFEQQQVRGLLVASYDPIEERLAAVRERGTPSVLVSQPAISPMQPSICLDDVDGGRQVGRHLVEIGCRRVAFVGGPLSVRQVMDRLTGFSGAVRDSGAGASLELVEAVDRTIAGGRAVARSLLERPVDERPDGVFAVNDLLGLGMLHELVMAHIRVPQEMALVGYDDTEFGAASLIPLSSVRGPHEEFGIRVVDLLFDEIDRGPGHERQVVLAPQLVIRDSSADFGG
jgi:LacI family transcriptional regulator, galactose operon repressor